MISVTQFEMSDLTGFTPKDIIPDLDVAMLNNMKNPNMDIVTLKDGDNTICLAGINHLRTGVVEAWLIPSLDVQKHKFGFFKSIKRLIDFVFQTMGVHRFVLAISCDWQEGAKWAHSLGFRFESIARAYDFNRMDHAIYTRIE